MFLQVQVLSQEILKSSQEYFGEDFCKNLRQEKLGTFHESLVARYLLEKNKDDYFSISHKKGLIFVGSGLKKIGVDIEIIQQRDESILEYFGGKEYQRLGGKDWKKFYVLWTAKEAIIKYKNLQLDDIDKIILEKAEKTDIVISEIHFAWELLLSFGDERFRVFSGGDGGERVWSVCY